MIEVKDGIKRENKYDKTNTSNPCGYARSQEH